MHVHTQALTHGRHFSVVNPHMSELRKAGDHFYEVRTSNDVNGSVQGEMIDLTRINILSPTNLYQSPITTTALTTAATTTM